MATGKFAFYDWVNSTFAKLANAVSLFNGTPAANSQSGFAGTANNATRGDHSHPLEPARFSGVIRTGTNPTPVFECSGGGSGANVNTAHFAPHYISTPNRAPLAPASVGVLVTGVATAGGTIRFGLWRCLPDGNIDLTSKVFESGEISTTSTGYKSLTYSTPIPEGLYWFGMVMHTAQCQIKTVADGRGIALANPFNDGQMQGMMKKDNITSAFPTSGGLDIGGDLVPVMFYNVV